MKKRKKQVEPTLSGQVFSHRRRLKLSQAELARMAGISRNYVSLIERGQARNVSLKLIHALAESLGVNPSVLLGESPADRVFIPPPLREFATEAGLRYDVVDRLVRIPRRGLEPHNPEGWKELFEAVQPYL